MNVPPCAVRRSAVLLVSLLLALPPAAAATWETLPRLTDVRHEGARQLGPQIATEGQAVVELPWAVVLEGRPCRRLVVSLDAARFECGPTPTIALPPPSPEASPRDVGLDRTLRMLPPGLARLGSASRIFATVAPDGLAIRWAAISVPGGVATFELLVDRRQRVTMQHLHVPPSIAGLPAGFDGASTAIRPASAQRAALGGTVTLDPPLHRATPKHSGPPPAGCVPEAGTWCDRADGPGTSEVWISEGFDDGSSTARGWSGSGPWHEIPFTTCPPGAFFDPGRSWYSGVDGTCLADSDVTGSLTSPTVGPISAGTLLTFSLRLQYEGAPFEQADLLVNGTPFATMPTTLDPTLWYTVDPPLDMSAFAGQTVTLEFVFDTDRRVNLLGWMVDDVILWNPAVGQPECIVQAGHGGRSACTDRQDTSWSFNEDDYCQGCQYSFYVLVECGREMHLPLEDMEGADVRITNVIDPTAPSPLRCVNDTARADAGLGPYRGSFLPAEGTGAALDCCADPAGPEVWFGPAFDVTDPTGHVAWGLADGCPSLPDYDPDVPSDGYECVDLLPSCGLLTGLSPGENQIMDCFIEDATGLCGLYRVDVTSGGFAWTLFANCDGTNTPQFPIFFDCTEAWAAYDPLPELALANLAVTGGCPDLTVEFDIVNLGCTEHPGDAVARIVASGADAACGLPPEVLDATVTGPFPPGSTTRVSRSITAPCAPARVDVTMDPDDLVPECTESPTAAACRAEAGLDTVNSFTCGCTAQVQADAGPDEAGCNGDRIRLTAGASVVTDCATRTLYKWTDDTGAVLSDWSTTATLDVTVRCPASRTYTVEVACEGESCSDTDDVVVTCIGLAADAGADQRICTGEPLTIDASASTITNCARPMYRFFDGVGNEVRGWTDDPVLDVAELSCAIAGDWLVEVGCDGETCTHYTTVEIECVEVVANAGPDLAGCEGIPVDITGAGSTSRGCTDVVYQWLDAGGAPLSGVLTDPDFSITLNGCPGIGRLVLIAACAEPGFETCGSFDLLDIACGNPAPPVAAVTSTCAGADVACGVAEPGVTYWWDADTATDADADGSPANDQDLAACDGTLSYPDATPRTARAWARDAGGCLTFVEIAAAALPKAATPAPSAAPGCPDTASTLRCGSAEPGIAWDYDVATDADGNTVPDDDAQATACETTATYAAGTWTARVTATNAEGCTASATVTFDVVAVTAPPEVANDRAVKAAGELRMGWDATPGAATYRVARGTIGTWYDHAIDVGRGACDTGGATTWSDADDASDGGDWYYLVTAVEPCGLEGTPGNGHDGHAAFARPARVPTASCP